MSIVTSCLVAGMDVHKRFVVVVVLDSSRPDEPVASGKYGTTFPEFGGTQTHQLSAAA